MSLEFLSPVWPAAHAARPVKKRPPALQGVSVALVWKTLAVMALKALVSALKSQLTSLKTEL